MTNNVKTVEEKLMRWEKMLYACYGAALTMLLQGIIKAFENEVLTGILFTLEEMLEASIFPQYYTDLSLVFFSPWRLVLWLVIEIVVLGAAAILSIHPAWRRSPSKRRTNLIFGYLLAGWVNLLALGAQDPINVGEVPGYNILVVGYLIATGLGYWLSHRKKDRAEEIFP